jgi:hypothetical protein
MNVIVKDKHAENQSLVYYYFDGKEWVQKRETNNLAAEVYMTNYFEEIEPVREQVLAGLASPLKYHMEYHFFNISLLSSYTGIPKRHIRKHLNPRYFNQLDEDTLNKYAGAFGISVEKLKKV